MKRTIATAALILTGLPLTACAATGTETDLHNGAVYTVTTKAGLDCDVFDTNSAGGVDCNFDAFTAPADWEGKTGSMETASAADGTIEVSRFTDGHLCVTFDGNESGGITCHYHTR